VIPLKLVGRTSSKPVSTLAFLGRSDYFRTADDPTTEGCISNRISDRDSPLWLGRDRRVLQQRRGEVHRV
jgi:hypothetical protein